MNRLLFTGDLTEVILSQENAVFVFGSNTGGFHGGGAARVAHDKFGAKMYQGTGRQGKSYAIPTKTLYNGNLVTMAYKDIQPHIDKFLLYAADNPFNLFFVTQIGCGLAGLKAEDMAPRFRSAPINCVFDVAWLPYLG